MKPKYNVNQRFRMMQFYIEMIEGTRSFNDGDILVPLILATVQLKFLKTGETTNPVELAAALNIDRKTASKKLRRLVAAEMLESDGKVYFTKDKWVKNQHPKFIDFMDSILKTAADINKMAD